jgi:hypothetical protein
MCPLGVGQGYVAPALPVPGGPIVVLPELEASPELDPLVVPEEEVDPLLPFPAPLLLALLPPLFPPVLPLDDVPPPVGKLPLPPLLLPGSEEAPGAMSA